MAFETTLVLVKPDGVQRGLDRPHRRAVRGEGPPGRGPEAHEGPEEPARAALRRAQGAPLLPRPRPVHGQRPDRGAGRARAQADRGRAQDDGQDERAPRPSRARSAATSASRARSTSCTAPTPPEAAKKELALFFQPGRDPRLRPRAHRPVPSTCAKKARPAEPLRGLTPALLAAVADEVGRRARAARVKAVHQDGEHRFRLALERGDTRRDLVLDLDPDLPRAHLADAAPAPRAPSPLAHALRNALGGRAFRTRRAPSPVNARSRSPSRSAGSRGRSGSRRSGARRTSTSWTRRGSCRSPRAARPPRARGLSVGAPFVPVPPRPDERAKRPAVGPEGPVQFVERLAADTARGAPVGGAEDGGASAALRQSLAKARGAVHGARGDGEAAARESAGAAARRGSCCARRSTCSRPAQTRVRVPDLARRARRRWRSSSTRAPQPGEQVAACFHEAERCERAEAEARARLPAARERAARARGGAGAARRRGAIPKRSKRSPRKRACRLPPRARRRTDARTAAREPVADVHVARRLDDPRGQGLARQRPADAARGLAPRPLPPRAGRPGGSHVIVTTPRGKSVPKDTLLDAAELACLYSQRAQGRAQRGGLRRAAPRPEAEGRPGRRGRGRARAHAAGRPGRGATRPSLRRDDVTPCGASVPSLARVTTP